MSHIKRVAGLVALVLVVVGVMSFISNLPQSSLSVTGKTIGTTLGGSDASYALATSLGVSGKLSDSMTLYDALRISPFLDGNERLLSETELTLVGAGIEPRTVLIGTISKNQELLEQTRMILSVASQRSIELARMDQEVIPDEDSVIVYNEQEIYRLEQERLALQEEYRIKRELEIKKIEEQRLYEEKARLEELEKQRLYEEQRMLSERLAAIESYERAKESGDDFKETITFANVLVSYTDEAVSPQTTIGTITNAQIYDISPDTTISELTTKQKETLLNVIVEDYNQKNNKNLVEKSSLAESKDNLKDYGGGEKKYSSKNIEAPYNPKSRGFFYNFFYSLVERFNENGLKDLEVKEEVKISCDKTFELEVLVSAFGSAGPLSLSCPTLMSLAEEDCSSKALTNYQASAKELCNNKCKEIAPKCEGRYSKMSKSICEAAQCNAIPSANGQYVGAKTGVRYNRASATSQGSGNVPFTCTCSESSGEGSVPESEDNDGGQESGECEGGVCTPPMPGEELPPIDVGGEEESGECEGGVCTPPTPIPPITQPEQPVNPTMDSVKKPCTIYMGVKADGKYWCGPCKYLEQAHPSISTICEVVWVPGANGQGSPCKNSNGQDLVPCVAWGNPPSQSTTDVVGSMSQHGYSV